MWLLLSEGLTGAGRPTSRVAHLHGGRTGAGCWSSHMGPSRGCLGILKTWNSRKSQQEGAISVFYPSVGSTCHHFRHIQFIRIGSLSLIQIKGERD